jgi:oxalate decarboxylase/phosphoglucose isomerase-like protein (cupin superfamily)
MTSSCSSSFHFFTKVGLESLQKNCNIRINMKLASIRELAGLKPVLKDPEAQGPDPVYWVFGEATSDRWANLTITTPGTYNGEFPKTFGHYHPAEAPIEVYHVIEGDGIFQLQKKHLDAQGNIVVDQVEEVVLIQAKPGDEIAITPEWGHSWSNVGGSPLLTFDNWRSGHSRSDYEPMEKQQGMAYYLLSDEGGEVKLEKNPKYQNLPEPRWMSADEFKEYSKQ